jgi:hypothetical protein
MMLLGTRKLSVLLAGTLLLCHGIFGALHLECIFPECADVAQHAAENTLLTGEYGGAHQHPADHGMDSEYFAVLVLFLGLLLRLLPTVAPFRIKIGMPRFPQSWRILSVSRPPPALPSQALQVFRL